jgi:hypothetical protein
MTPDPPPDSEPLTPDDYPAPLLGGVADLRRLREERARLIHERDKARYLLAKITERLRFVITGNYCDPDNSRWWPECAEYAKKVLKELLDDLASDIAPLEDAAWEQHRKLVTRANQYYFALKKWKNAMDAVISAGGGAEQVRRHLLPLLKEPLP